MKKNMTKEKVKKHLKWLIPTFLLISIIVVITLLIDDYARAEKAAEEAFNGKVYSSDNNIQGYSIYLPQGFILESESENNVELIKGTQQYLVFINDKEGPTSKVVYDSMTEREGAELDATFESSDKFGYIVANELDKDVLLTVGVGGVKVTTKTDENSLESDASDMMKIANSVKPAEEEKNVLDEE